jgi:hypothetical protein
VAEMIVERRATWTMVRSVDPDIKNHCLQTAYDNLTEDARCMVDDAVEALMTRVKKKNPGIRFSRYNAREVIFNVFFFEYLSDFMDDGSKLIEEERI